MLVLLMVRNLKKWEVLVICGAVRFVLLVNFVVSISLCLRCKRAERDEVASGY